MAHDFESLKTEYGGLWRRMQVRPERANLVDQIAKRLISFKPRYEAVAGTTGVPWFVIAVLHQRESAANFAKHLHNGNPLTARTRHVPAGRPAHGDPPFSWETSATDALTMPPHSLHLVKEWPIERVCYEIEKYNGFGYRDHHPQVKSPYLWSFTTIYDRGKYVADGRFDDGTVDQQCGTMPILRRMGELDSSVRFGDAEGPAPVDAGLLALGSTGERVRELQSALAHLGFQVGEVDSEFGPVTAAAVKAFQTAHHLPVTAIADQATQQALASALAKVPAESSHSIEPREALSREALAALFRALLTNAQAPMPNDADAQQRDAANNALQLILGAFMGRRPVAAATGAPPPEANKPILSPIDKMLGGEALVGKKSALAILAYVVLVILKAAGVVGAATPAGQIMTVLIAAFGALGGVSKIDRAVQALGMIAAKAPK
jgi:lysozyme family protein/peptidoglycan hydrolase-like protein with peptidoglycan-binding domain